MNFSISRGRPHRLLRARIVPRLWSFGCRIFLLIFLPKRLSALVDRWAVVARVFAGLISEAAPENRFREATTSRKVTIVHRDLLGFFVEALVVDVPFFDLLKEQQLVVLVHGPAHVENVGVRFSLKELPHVLSSFFGGSGSHPGTRPFRDQIP